MLVSEQADSLGTSMADEQYYSRNSTRNYSSENLHCRLSYQIFPRNFMADHEINPTANIITAIASLVSAFAWPAIAILVIYGLYSNTDKIISSFNEFMKDKDSAKFGFSSSGGVTLEIIQKTARVSANAVISSANKSTTGPLSEDQKSQVGVNAQSAAISLASNSLDPRTRLKILWVDDHPENNIDLQLALQTLGIVVICIDSNEGISQAFDNASSFDVVITDINRDELGDGRRQAEPEGGLKTVEIIMKNYPNTKVIVYAGGWAATHRNDSLQKPIIRITNYPEEVYQIVVNLAKTKALLQ